MQTRGGRYMTFVHWNPLHELTEAHKHFSTFVNEALRHGAQPQKSRETWNPAVDVSEAADGYMFALELPGMAPETVAVEVKDNILTVKGERKAAVLKDGERYLHRERPQGRFARVFRMRKPVNADGVTASYRDGVLSVVVPFRTETKSRKIHVQG
jgi:HSP20 family protein